MKYIAIIILLIAQFSYSQTGQVDYSQFIGEKAKIVISKKYPFSRLYNYKINSQNFDSISVKPFNTNIPENVLTTKYASNLAVNKKDSIMFAINFLSKLDIDIQDKRFAFIKYKIKENDKLTDSKVFTAIREDKIWQENALESAEINILKSIVENSSVNILYAFYNKRDSKKYPEINKLKPLVKDANGVLNIEKLAKVIKENKSTLSKYLEE